MQAKNHDIIIVRLEKLLPNWINIQLPGLLTCGTPFLKRENQLQLTNKDFQSIIKF